MVTPLPVLGARFLDAMAWVTELHRNQPSKGAADVPFASHLLSVAALTLEDGGDETDVVIALCHDAVEDQGGEATLAEVRRRFGDEVADAVALLSDSRGEPKAPWRERKDQLLAQLSGADATERVLRVAAADKLHNARTLLMALNREGRGAWARFAGAPADYVAFYRAVGAILAERYAGSVNAAELERVTDALALWVPEDELVRPA